MEPILVSDGDGPPSALVVFKEWDGRRVIAIASGTWDNYALLKNYDYTADISEGV